MINVILRTTVFVILGLTFFSCMHAVMMGNHDNHEGMDPITVTKEVISGDNTLTVTIPPMETNKESTIIVSLRSKSEAPDSSLVQYMITKSEMTSASGHEHGMKDDSTGFIPIHQIVSMKNDIASIAYSPANSGQFTLSVETTVNSAALTTELSFMVHENKEHGIMGMGADWDYPILGVLAMSAMMISMWVIRGGL